MWYGESFKLKIYYLFMLADGRCSDGENDKFDKICQTMKADDKDKQEVIDYCNKAISVFSDDNSAMVTAEISNLLSAYGSFLEKSDEAEVIWNLINLAYADGEYSEPEKRVVTFLKNCWNALKQCEKADSPSRRRPELSGCATSSIKILPKRTSCKAAGWPLRAAIPRSSSISCWACPPRPQMTSAVSSSLRSASSICITAQRDVPKGRASM